MLFKETPLAGAFLVELEPKSDDRGFFARAFCVNEFGGRGLSTRFVQGNLSFNARRGTLRGLHYQLAPKAETKLVRCVAGAIHDVLLDLRPGSPTFGKSFGAELSASNRLAMYIPHGVAHGFLSLTDAAEIFYLHDEFHDPGRERGVRWNDPRFAISWPMAPAVISDRDRAHPDFDPAWHLGG